MLPAPSRATGGTATDSSPFTRIRARTEVALAPVEVAAHHLLSRDLDERELREARAAAVRLAGALGRLQHPGIAQPARRIATLFETDTPDRATGIELAGAIEDTRTMLASAAEQLAANPSTASTVLAVGDPSAAFDTVLWVLAHFGHAVQHTDGGDDGAAPDAVVVHVDGDSDGAARVMLPAVAELYPSPLLVLHGAVSPRDRVRFARHAAALLPDDTDPAVISEELLRIRAAATTSRRASVYGHVGAERVLDTHGFEVRTVGGLDDLHDLEGCAVVFGPDVALRDRHRATRLLRADPPTRRIPVVWEGPLSSAQSLAAAHLGVMVAEPFDDTTAAWLTSELRRAAADVDPASVRPDTVLAWSAARLLIDRMLIASQRANAPAAIAVVRVGDDPYGIRADVAAEQLGREFRRGDVVGRTEQGDFVVSLAGISSRTALDRLSGLAGRLSGDTRIGVADFPVGGRSADDLVLAATSAAERAAAAAGPAVVSTSWRPAEDQPTDVLIIDRDVVLGDMVAGALAGIGLRASVMEDGHEALSFLLGAPPHELPRLLLVDLDLGGADGRALLSSLDQTGVLADVRVIAMASKGTENGLRIALKHGASDVIRKPFPMTILLHRVTQVLGG